jgi:hypothetical protein
MRSCCVASPKMNLLPNKNPPQPLAAQEVFFLELWHSMTHELSLDSHRVRCLNARMIVRELDQELRTGRLAQEEFVELCAEALEILDLDHVVPVALPHHYGLLKPLLTAPPLIQPDKRKEAKAEQAYREFRFTVADFSSALVRVYQARLLEMLPDAIASTDQEHIWRLVGALLSDLVDEGWALDSLFRWVDLFFREKKQPHHATFAANLNFMVRQLSGNRQRFRVILRLSGSSKLSEFGTFGGFAFRALPGFTPDTPQQRKFAVHSSVATFAEAEVEAVDFHAAAIKARETFENCLDLLRFNFEPAPLKIDERCYVERCGDNRVALPVVRHLIPNPAHHLPADAFRDFSDQMGDVLERSSIEQESRERLRAAVRHYRFGRDADSYKDKFLNWWMGLEFLAFTSHGESIGQTVVRHASDALVQRYLYRLLGDLLRTLKEHKIAWSPDFSETSGCRQLDDLTSAGLLDLLQAATCVEQLAQTFSDNPVAAFRIRRLADHLQDPKKTADLLKQHHNHLVWQVGRLYRLRCCIVHGTPLPFRLPLFAANLEFYLRELIVVCLRALNLNSHIASLREVFQRAALVRSRTHSELGAQAPRPDAIRMAVFNAMIIQEPP